MSSAFDSQLNEVREEAELICLYYDEPDLGGIIKTINVHFTAFGGQLNKFPAQNIETIYVHYTMSSAFDGQLNEFLEEAELIFLCFDEPDLDGIIETINVHYTISSAFDGQLNEVLEEAELICLYFDEPDLGGIIETINVHYTAFGGQLNEFPAQNRLEDMFDVIEILIQKLQEIVKAVFSRAIVDAIGGTITICNGILSGLSELSTVNGAADGIKYSIFSVVDYQWSNEHADGTAASFARGHTSTGASASASAFTAPGSVAAPLLGASGEGVIGAIIGAFVGGIVCAAAGHWVYRNVFLNLKVVHAKFANSAAIKYIICLCLFALLHMVGERSHNCSDPLATSA
jgi:hypothetical protein